MGFGVSRRNGLGTGDGNGDGDAAYRTISSRMHVYGFPWSSTPQFSPLFDGRRRHRVQDMHGWHGIVECTV
jgi:hypothetical protein